MKNYILEMRNIRKTFLNGKVIANDNITLKILSGEIHALVGENGAGKSTLMKLLNGLYLPTSGKIFYKGREIIISSPNKAAKLGIGMVYQHFMLIPTLTVAENMILGVETKKGICLDLNQARKKIIEVSQKYGFSIDPDTLISDLSIGMQQKVEILKILFKGANLLVFDEPTAVLTPQEIKELYIIMKNLVSEGKTIIFISHKLQEVLDISDNITVIRKGKNIVTFPTKIATKEKIANAMVGRPILFNVKKPNVTFGKTILSVKNLNFINKNGVEKLKNISFDIKQGEILGIAGVEGSGQGELIDIITGLLEANSGEIYLENSPIKGVSPRKISLLGLSHIPEDRHKKAAISQFSIMKNFALGLENDFYSKFGLFDFNKLKATSESFMEKYDIRPRNIFTAFGNLSGGNQQKVVVARELEKHNSHLLIAAQPTRGVDIGAIESIHNLILNEKSKGKAILLISSELSEIMSLSDKIIVLCSGKITGNLPIEEATEEKLGILMVGGKIDEK